MSGIQNRTKSPKLNSLQLGLLRLFNQNIDETQTLEVKRILMDYFDNQLKAELKKVIKKKRYTDKDYKNMLNGNF